MPVAAIAGPLISGASSILGGLFGSKTAKGSANILSNAALEAAQLENNAASNAQNAVNLQQVLAQAGIGTAVTGAQQGVAGAVGAGQQAVSGATTQANDTLKGIYDQIAGYATPYINLGTQGAQTLSAAISPGGSLSGNFSFDPTKIAENPDYQFQLQQGLQAVQRAQAATGGLQGGATLKSLTQYAQGLASNEIGQAYNQALTTYQTNRQNTLANINALLSGGQYGLGTLQSAGQNYGNQAANNILSNAIYGSNLGVQGAQYTGNLGVQGAQTIGNIGLQAQQYSGNVGLQQAGSTGNWLMDAAIAQAQGKTASTNNLLGALNGGLSALNSIGTNIWGWNGSSTSGGTLNSINNLPIGGQLGTPSGFGGF